MKFELGVVHREGLRRRIVEAYRRPEHECMTELIARARLDPAQLERAQAIASGLARKVRESRTAASGMDTLMQEFSLSSQEGVALMCLAEALLRIPDSDTVDRLIRDKLSKGDWGAHVGASPSVFVNAAAWGLLVTGRLVEARSESGLAGALTGILRRGGEPLVRAAMGMAMRLLGKQFVTGETIEEALERSRERGRLGFRFSFDILGEAAITGEEADRYFHAYEHAIRRIGASSRGRGIRAGPGISLKLSALHPRFSRAQRERVMAELLPRVVALMRLAREHDIGFNVDAEEADRLDLALDIVEALAVDPGAVGWDGIGFVVQAYQRRAPAVADWLVDLARRTGRRLMVRLVKGAYWDAEIKRAQVDGLADYPVFTRKAHSDVCFIACARRLLAAPDAVYPQFATHNALSIAAVAVIGEGREFEYQCLYGMGEALYDHVVGPSGLDRPCRVYAPVGTHETLLAYLVRRLLENGSNSSFVNRIVDPDVSIEDLVADPCAQAQRYGGSRHPRIPLPGELFGDRRNSAGVDWSGEGALEDLVHRLAEASGPDAEAPVATHLIDAPVPGESGGGEELRNPADHGDVVGRVIVTGTAGMEAALRVADEAAHGPVVPVARRAAWLEAAADLMEARRAGLLCLAVREAGKSLPNALGEVREAVDFCRYYAARARAGLDDARHRPLGAVACISPWNFPLAIFVGQVSAALAAGNPVLAKPAEQTPLTAHAAVRLFHEAGVPRGWLQLLPGSGEHVGAGLVADPRVKGVLFTGSTEVARSIERTLAQRAAAADAVLVAETGGLNAMIVDSSALPEQVVIDALASAFDSAGQRCSALRVLCLQEEIAPRTLELLKGAMSELRVGSPARLASDVGPVIDEAARRVLERHVERMRAMGCAIFRVPLPEACARGTFVAPTLVEIPSLEVLEGEVFGPVLHVLHFRRGELAALVDRINATGYGLTHGIHSRIEETVREIVQRVRAGNVYVNRNIIGAVVGVQPFGGEGLSGTGPKAGGPIFLHCLVRPASLADSGPAPEPSSIEGGVATGRFQPASSLVAWIGSLAAIDEAQRRALVERIEGYARLLAAFGERTLPGPTGERNTLSFEPRGRVGCFASTLPELAHQIALATLTGNVAALPGECGSGTGGGHGAAERALASALDALRSRLGTSSGTAAAGGGRMQAALVAGSAAERAAVRLANVAASPGIVPLVAPLEDGCYPVWRLLVERVVSVNTTAEGGNASLMALAAQ